MVKNLTSQLLFELEASCFDENAFLSNNLDLVCSNFVVNIQPYLLIENTNNDDDSLTFLSFEYSTSLSHCAEHIRIWIVFLLDKCFEISTCRWEKSNTTKRFKALALQIFRMAK